MDIVAVEMMRWGMSEYPRSKSMSILIKGIEKPKYGFIEIRLYDNRAECEFQEHVYTDLETEEVPEPHGRLIDADELIKEQSYTAKDTSVEEMRVACRYCAEVLKDAPTVIEAENGKDS